MKLKQIDLNYEIDATSHWMRCRELLEKATNISQFFYAALELRCCIERLCFEYLVLLTHGKRELSKSELKAYGPKDFFKMIERESPFFDKVVDFINAGFEVDQAGLEMQFPDIKWLQETHGKLGNFLHLQKEEMTNNEKLELVNFVQQAFNETTRYITSARASISDLQNHAQMIFEKFIAGEITKEEMKRMLELSNIPRHMFEKPKWT